jgi:hypothetical protein
MFLLVKAIFIGFPRYILSKHESLNADISQEIVDCSSYQWHADAYLPDSI